MDAARDAADAWRVKIGEAALSRPEDQVPRSRATLHAPRITRNAPRSTHRVRLLSILGVTFGLAVAIGNTIGAGILRTPGDVAAILQTPWLFIGVWIVGALYALLGANALAELGTMLPRSGAQYVYARRAFGDYAGFVVGWNDWISTCASTSAISIVIGESLAAVIPGWSARACRWHWRRSSSSPPCSCAAQDWRTLARNYEFLQTVALIVPSARVSFWRPAAAARAPNVVPPSRRRRRRSSSLRASRAR
jgi:hypothetical protein